jgi:hypothetical protein
MQVIFVMVEGRKLSIINCRSLHSALAKASTTRNYVSIIVPNRTSPPASGTPDDDLSWHYDTHKELQRLMWVLYDE